MAPPWLEMLLARMSDTPWAAAMVPFLLPASLLSAPVNFKARLPVCEPIWPAVLSRLRPAIVALPPAVRLPSWLLMSVFTATAKAFSADRLPLSLFSVWAFTSALPLAYTSPLFCIAPVMSKMTLSAVMMACFLLALSRWLLKLAALKFKSLAAAT